MAGVCTGDVRRHGDGFRSVEKRPGIGSYAVGGLKTDPLTTFVTSQALRDVYARTREGESEDNEPRH